MNNVVFAIPPKCLENLDLASAKLVPHGGGAGSIARGR
jgi:hypothetical protein